MDNPFASSIRHTSTDIKVELGRELEKIALVECAECNKNLEAFLDDFLCVWCRYTQDTGRPTTPWHLSFIGYDILRQEQVRKKECRLNL